MAKKKLSALKPFEEWTFDELVTHATGRILQGLIAGDFKGSVWMMMNLALQWGRERKD